MASKWAFLDNGVFERFTGDNERYEKVKALAKSIAEEDENDRTKLSNRLARLKEEKKQIEKDEKDCNLQIDAVEEVLLSQFEKSEESLFRIITDEGERSIFVTYEPYSTVVDWEAFDEWIKENDLEDMYTVHTKTLNSAVKERLLNAEPEPPGIKVFLKKSVGIRKV